MTQNVTGLTPGPQDPSPPVGAGTHPRSAPRRRGPYRRFDLPRARHLTQLGGRACLAALLAVAAGPASAGTADICRKWGAVAAAEHAVPERLVLAIARVETGRGDGAQHGWPWAVNAEGTGRWFATRDEAVAFARARLAAGADQIDLGCFQLNLHWHGRAFDGLDDMIDPARNARYAARFLAALYDEFGDWRRAAAAYHSRTREHARAYLARLDPVLRSMPPAARFPAAALDGLPAGHGAVRRPTAPAARVASARGSLFPLAQSAGPALIDFGGEGRP